MAPDHLSSYGDMLKPGAFIVLSKAVYVCIILLMAVQDLTPGQQETPTTSAVVNYDDLDAAKKTLVDYRALSGLITDDASGAGFRKMPMEELAGKLGVSRQTLYDWQGNIPNFWEMVNQRRAQISPQSRLALVEETWFMKARKGDWQFVNAWLLNYKPGYRTPAAKVEHEAGQSLVDLFKQVEQQQRPDVIEATVIPDADTTQQ